jgi:uncharacterized membrane protein YczE
MPVLDWPVWPIFVVELIAFLLLFLPISKRFLKLKIHTWIIVILIGIDIGIAVSLAHDSTTPLNLYF